MSEINQSWHFDQPIYETKVHQGQGCGGSGIIFSRMDPYSFSPLDPDPRGKKCKEKTQKIKEICTGSTVIVRKSKFGPAF